MADDNAPELYRKYRPKSLDTVVGQPEVCRDLKNFLETKRFPHVSLLAGPSGCGKTTLARIVARGLECSRQDFAEINCSDFRGVDTIREIRSLMALAPIGGKVRVWYVDECHNLTKDAQNAALKMWEDTPDHVYFVLATTEPEKLLKTVQTRAQWFKLKNLDKEILQALVIDVYAKETKDDIDPDIAERVAEAAEGSARKALVLLNGLIGLTEPQMQAAIGSPEFRAEGIEIARALCNGQTNWSAMAKILKASTLGDKVESLRHMVLSYAKAILLNGAKNTRAIDCIFHFSKPFFDSKDAGFIGACYEVINK
jgi:DNA polymerase III delta prime subunit